MIPEILAVILVIAVITLTLKVAYSLGVTKGRRKSITAPRFVGQNNTANEFDGKVAIITGGGTGLGRAIALALSKRGARVVIASRKQEHLDETAHAIRAMGGEVLTYSFDVRDPDQVNDMVKTTVDKFGRVDILVNNAAGNFVVPAEKLSPNGWRAVIEIVLNGSWFCTSACGKQMIEQGSGSILNIVANYASSGYPGVVHSAAAKAGVLNMTRTLACEWGQKGIRVNAFAPGTMPSKGASGSRNLNFAAAGAMKKIESNIPLGRLTDAEEMAELAVFLLSDQAVYVSGEVFTADGGASMPRGFLDLEML